MKIVIASGNSHKVDEIKRKCTGFSVDFLSLKDFPDFDPPEETGSSFEENALIKARSVFQFTGLPALADDSGLAVNALDGAPGIYSARYGGEGLSDRERWMLLLTKMKGEKNRDASFICSMILVTESGEIHTTGVCEGIIAQEPEGDQGFGYDPIFFLPDHNRTMAQLSDDKKNLISHRGRALDSMIPYLEKLSTI
jgi:XTP/dITP diphosphohydrolase